MPRFQICPDTAVMGQNAMEQIGRELESLQSEAVAIRKDLRFKIRQQDEINNHLKRIEERIGLQQEDSIRLAQCLRGTVELYQQRETQVVQEYRGEAVSGEQEKIDWQKIGWIAGGLLPLILNPATAPFVIGAATAPIIAEWWKTTPDYMEETTYGEFLGIETSKTHIGDKWGLEAKADGYVDLDKNIAIVGMAELAGYIYKNTHEGSWGIFSGSTETAVGAGEIRGEAKCALFDDGKFDPELSLKARARVEGIAGEIRGQMGSDELNAHVQGNGYIGVAKAEAKATASLTEGIAAKVEVGAAALSGTAKAGFTIGDFDIDLYVTGEAGSVGAGAGFAASSDNFEIEGKLAALLGLGLKLRISW